MAIQKTSLRALCISLQGQQQQQNLVELKQATAIKITNPTDTTKYGKYGEGQGDQAQESNSNRLRRIGGAQPQVQQKPETKEGGFFSTIGSTVTGQTDSAANYFSGVTNSGVHTTGQSQAYQRDQKGSCTEDWCSFCPGGKRYRRDPLLAKIFWISLVVTIVLCTIFVLGCQGVTKGELQKKYWQLLQCISLVCTTCACHGLTPEEKKPKNNY